MKDKLIVEAQNAIESYNSDNWIDAPQDVINLISRLTTALKEAEEKGGWQPIETAPKDGTDILVATFRPSLQAWEMMVVYYTDDYGDTYKWLKSSNTGADDLFPYKHFSHWKLPHPPVEGE